MQTKLPGPGGYILPKSTASAAEVPGAAACSCQREMVPWLLRMLDKMSVASSLQMFWQRFSSIQPVNAVPEAGGMASAFVAED